MIFTMLDPLSGLNEQQREAVQATSGPVLILAGAGSGKTRALTHRIAYVIHQGIASPSEILAVTFTNKAASQMKQRVGQLLGQDKQTPTAISTFHSLGARLLREAASFTARSRTFTILDGADSERFVRQALRQAGIQLRQYSPRTVRQAISAAKNQQHTPQTYAATAHGPIPEIVAMVWPAYERLLASSDAYDFDDLLIETVRLLERNSQVRSALHDRWRYLSVDEYQDTNAPQEAMLRLLLGPEKNICVVGDDYQAIYSWRGSNVDHILGFEARFPGCRVIRLTQNYRSTPQILAAAGEVIAGNTRQKHKALWTQNAPGKYPEIMSLASDREEAAWIRQRLVDHVDAGGSLGECAVLYRTNAQSRLLEEEFLSQRLPYTIVGGFRFYERREIKDALALLHWHVNPDSRIALERLAPALLARVGPKTVDRWVQEAAQSAKPVRQYLATLSATRPGLAQLLRAYANIPTAGLVADQLRHLLTASGYLKAVRALPDGEERLENIDELLNVSSVYDNPVQFLEDVSLFTDSDTDHATDKITCMTLHAAKGLEFPIVFIAGCEENLLPHVNSHGDRAKLEEERRLLYVGMTRAQQHLTLTYAAMRYQAGQLQGRLPSRFLDTITSATRVVPEETEGIDETVEYLAQGQWVDHPQFGRGIVVAMNTNNLTCVFEGYGVKTIDRHPVS